MTIPNKFNNGELADAPLVNENFDYLDTLTEDIAKSVKLLSDTSTFTKYDETKTYAKDDIVTVLSPDGRIVAYISLKNENNGNALSDENWWKKTELGGGNMPVGTIFPHSASTTFVPENSLPCDGMEYAQTQFPTLYTDWLVGKKLETCTYEKYQQEITATGECLKFGIDTAKGKFKVPTKLNKYISPNYGGEAPVKGNGIAIGYTDGVHNTVAYETSPYGFVSGSEAEFGKPVGTKHSSGGGILNNDVLYGLTTDGSKSGIVADLSNAIKAKGIRYFVVVATGAIKQSEMDWSQWASGLEAKANKDLSNVTGIDLVEDYNINPDGSWYRKYKSGWLEQGGKLPKATNTSYIVTFPKPFENTNFYISKNINIESQNAPKYSACCFFDITTTSAKTMTSADNGGYSTWYACGQGV